MDLDQIIWQHHADGYFVVDDIAPALLDPLEQAALRVVAKARAGEVDLKRGQTVFCNHKLTHRGRKPADRTRRLSVAGCLKACDPAGIDDYAGDLWRWRRADNLRDFLPATLQLFYNRWRSLKPPAST